MVTAALVAPGHFKGGIDMLLFLVYLFGFVSGIAFLFLAAAFAVSGKESKKEEKKD